MTKRATWIASTFAALLMGLTATPARAQMAVIDAAAIRQLIQQIAFWRQQIAAMEQEYDQLQQTHAALTGPRGMQALLPLNDAQRNYLPGDWNGVAQVLAGQSAQYGVLAQQVNATINANAVLTPAQLAALPVAERSSLIESRRAAAGLAVMTREAYAQAGARFAALSQLVQAIGAAGDAKAIEDLQGRIAAEQAMLGNEQAKLAVLAQLAEAEERAQALQLRELAIAGHGRFEQRFRPVLP
jgi:type IV secretion system protein VirB5